MLLWGPPSKFVSGSWGPKQDKSEIHYVEDGRTADRLLNWINKKMNRYNTCLLLAVHFCKWRYNPLKLGVVKHKVHE